MRSQPFFRVQRGSLVLLLIYVTATVTMAVDGIAHPARKYFSLLFFCLGLAATVREYMNWRRGR